MIRRAAIVFFCFLAGAAIASREFDRSPSWDCVFNVSFNRGDATDRSWVGANGTLTNGATTGSNRYLTCDGTNDYVDFGNQTTHNCYPITMSVWFNVRTQDQVAYATMFGRYSSGSWNGFFCWMDTSERVVALYGRNSTNYVGADGRLQSSGSYKDGNWHHLAVVVNSGGATMYIDGASVDTDTWTGTAQVTTSAASTKAGDHTSGFYWKGDLDDIRIYNRDLSAAEVAAIYATGRF